MASQIAFMFGGVSAEHEVSIVTGLQALEHLDRTRFTPYVVYVSKTGEWLGYGDLESRKAFTSTKPKTLAIGKDAEGPFFKELGITGRTIRPIAAYMAFHGGTGESGPVQGALETIDLAFTCGSQESQAITMNKALCKEVLRANGLPVVNSVRVHRADVLASSAAATAAAIQAIPLPVIVKPVHLGSSIGIHIAKTETELEKYLLEAAYLDTETLVETLVPSFKEYNCAVRLINGVIETSAIESPVAKDEILSFADKYQRGGGKKTGGSGMASLQRELPAKISAELQKRIEETAKSAFVACRCKGMVRIDFMVSGDNLTITEINPIPGSMAFYMWEAKGISFQQQISDLLDQAIRDQKTRVDLRMDYTSDIVEKFIAQ